jgi:ABC-type polysaccharide/polyol phosphate export permease
VELPRAARRAGSQGTQGQVQELRAGFAWSLLNPLLYLAVYTFVFDFLLGSGHRRLPDLPAVRSARLDAVLDGAHLGDVVHRRGRSLIKKVFFPREILPLASMGAAFIHFLLQFLVLIAVLVA